MATRNSAPPVPVIGYVLPPQLAALVAAHCAATGEDPAAFIADAVQLHLDELGPLFDDEALRALLPPVRL